MTEPWTPKLTPLQEALVETLIARHRLGEPFWNFTANAANRAAFNVLTELCVVEYDSGHTENTIRAWFTRVGHGYYTARSYVPTRAIIEYGVDASTDYSTNTRVEAPHHAKSATEIIHFARSRSVAAWRRWVLTSDWELIAAKPVKAECAVKFWGRYNGGNTTVHRTSALEDDVAAIFNDDEYLDLSSWRSAEAWVKAIGGVLIDAT